MVCVEIHFPESIASEAPVSFGMSPAAAGDGRIRARGRRGDRRDAGPHRARPGDPPHRRPLELVARRLTYVSGRVAGGQNLKTVH